jgi:hypothetical protein
LPRPHAPCSPSHYQQQQQQQCLACSSSLAPEEGSPLSWARRCSLQGVPSAHDAPGSWHTSVGSNGHCKGHRESSDRSKQEEEMSWQLAAAHVSIIQGTEVMSCHLEMILPLELLTKDASIGSAQPPTEDQTFSDQKRRPWIDPMEYSSENCERDPSFNKHGMANTRCGPRHILSEGLNVAPKEHAGAKQSSSA